MGTKGSKTISISIPAELDDWLEEHKEINRSKLFQDAVLQTINKKTGMTPLLLLTAVMGVCFSILLMIASIGLSFLIGFYMMITMFLIGVGLLGITMSIVLNVKKHDADTVQ